MDYSGLKSIIIEMVPWIKDSGLSFELAEERHVIFKLPMERHLNHVGIVYAGSLFMLMEIAGAGLMAVTYDFTKYVPINKRMSIEFLKPGVTDLYCELSITAEEAAAKIKPIDENGRGEWILDMEVKDENGQVCATSRCTYYIKKFG